MVDSVGGDTIKVPDEPNEKGNLDVKTGPPSAPPASTGSTTGPSVQGGDTIKQESSKPETGSKPPSSRTDGGPKSDSRTAGGSLKKGGSSKSRLDDIPEEASQYAEDPSRQLTNYILVKQIGKGGMGAVWKAWDKKLTRWVAIKFLLVSEDEDVMRFQREAKLAARLRHPNIAPIYEVGEAPATQAGQSTRHYLAMEYIDGTTMSAATEFPIAEILDIFMKVAQGMEAAHKAGVVHRDLKPANIMLTTDKWPYVMDFGLAKAIQAESSISVSGAVMGTPAYMPPEQAEGKLDQIDAQSDVYSLGATMYAVLCKKQPFSGQTPMAILMAVCKEDPIPLRTHNANVPEQVEQIVLKAMAKEKADRYPSAQALADDLKRYLTNQDIEAKGPSSLKLAAKQVKRNIWPVVVGLIVLAAGGVIAWLATRPQPKPIPPPPPVVIVKDPSPVVVKDPPVEDPNVRIAAEAAKKAQEWYNAWGPLSEALDYDTWKPGDATLGVRVQKHLLAMKADAPNRDTDIKLWFQLQTGKTDDVVRDLRNTKDAAVAGRLVGWCGTILAALKDVDSLKRYADQVQKARDAAVPIANYKGSVTLKILVGPFAEITKLTSGGKDVVIKQRLTPAMIGPVEIGDIEVEFTHGSTKKLEKIPAAQLKDGRIYQITGRMQDARLKVVELP
ncbi:MAG: serine/threonine protein kinase [Planctomycetes bacterium]|nr:serine/threonine protein kinase [Planctomycetota bacterium]